MNLSQVIDDIPFGKFHWRLCIGIGVCLMIDGFDVQAMGYVAPALILDWNVARSALGPVFSAALVGILVGSLLLSMLADKIGRRPVLIGATILFALLTFWTARVSSITELIFVRFLTGIGLGGIMPNAIALLGEFSPARLRVAVMMVVGNGFNIGAAFGGFLAAWLIPAFGWRSVFYFGAVVPLVIAAYMVFSLPESLQFQVIKGKDSRRIRKTLQRLAPTLSVDVDQSYEVREESKQGIPVIHLFSEGRAATTALLWIIFFVNLLNLYLLASWLPTLVSGLGYSTSQSVLVGSTLQLGGLISTLVMSLFVRRLGISTVITLGFVIGCISIALIGQVGFSLPLLFVSVFAAGWGVVGNMATLIALVAVFYPTYLRSTGLGWCLGIGRLGAIVGPLFAGELVRRRWENEELFLAAASLALLGTAVMILLHRWMTPERAST